MINRFFKTLLIILSCFYVHTASAKLTILSEYEYTYLPENDGTTKTCADMGYITASEQPSNTNCSKAIVSGQECYYNCRCKDGYVEVDNVCTLNDCSGYPISGACPANGNCTKCPTDNYYKLNSCNNNYSISGNSCVCSGNGATVSGSSCICNTSKGWKGTPPNCSASGCPTGYSNTISSCSNSYESLSCSGYSGGSQCCLCSCKDADATCTAENYPLTSQPSGTYLSCSPGCGSTTTRYKSLCSLTSTDTTYKYTTCPTNASCTLGCNNKFKFDQCQTGYYDVDACYYDDTGTNFGPLSAWTAENMGL